MGAWGEVLESAASARVRPSSNARRGTGHVAVLSPLRMPRGPTVQVAGTRSRRLSLADDDLCFACAPGASLGWVHPSAQAIEMDLEIAAFTYGLCPPE